MFKSGLKYKLKAVNAHGIHSPFVFTFYNEVLKKTARSKKDNIEALRKTLLNDETEIEITDFGAGSRIHKSNKRKVKDIAKYALVSKKYGRLLNRIVEFYGLSNSLELGTSLGVGAAYLSASGSKVTTLEGCEKIAAKAKINLNQLGFSKVDLRVGEFNKSIEDLGNIQYDLIYIDGNHQEEPTIAYFEKFIEYAHNDTFIIFDDIRWSVGMERAWQKIIASDKINVSIELLRMGIVLKRKEQEKEHFILKF